MKESVKYRILDFLESSSRYNTLTAKQAQARFKVKNVGKIIRELREEGFSIYTNKKTLVDGRKIQFYRLGSPSKQFTKHYNAGRIAKAVACLTA